MNASIVAQLTQAIFLVIERDPNRIYEVIVVSWNVDCISNQKAKIHTIQHWFQFQSDEIICFLVL